MTDPSLPDVSTDSPGIEPQLPTYPDTAIGTLMWQRDQAKASANSNRLLSAQILESALESDAKAVQLQAAIDSLGGETT